MKILLWVRLMLYSKIIFFIFFTISLFSSELVVVVPKNCNLQNISKKELSKIFLGKTKRFPNGEEAIAVEIVDEKYQNLFYEKIINKDEKQLKKYWAKMIFTGRAQPPKKLNTLIELKEFFKENQNAISYIPSQFLDNNLKIVLKIK